MPVAQLLNSFRADIEQAQRLLELLESEHHALCHCELAVLESLLGDKTRLLDELDRQRHQRSDLLRASGLSADRAGLETLAARSSDGEALLEAATQLAELLDSCQGLNQRNGRLIQNGQTNVEGLLMVVRGKNDAAGLYNRLGQSAASIARQRPLSQA
ncbi:MULTISPECIES: flagella synthesis protein FlgN [Pseudomonas]|uniref:Flagella synthesis protein FlgN n=1 Tax=Pseudomonas flexibilis TaxID=706570 RepID=A0A0B2D804_9PSED|nr:MULTISPECIES: flagellar protein FlgN [Pseudomonas]KHL70674.1 hypothetical protein SF06_07580 [Pseudomonas flexibilis]KHO66181.1 hypothetical protein PT85_00960 [Pseudomonas flexibilis]SCY45641.1 flagella synthesis protein FlgN [Pseudomonas flexibilis]SIR13245.1 flagella synthesis protein FlgN [Pseudomonas flexibilis]